MEIITIETPSLGDRSYILVDRGEAAVIDPQRDVDRVESVLAERGLQAALVLETHVHNDYVTGGVELARRAGVGYVVAADEQVTYERIGARDGDEFRIGGLVVRAVHTPGHTPHHLSFVVSDEDRPVAAFTGGSMLYGTVGRTDLIADARTQELTRAQFRSVRRLSEELAGDVAVHPTHGFGSFCSSASTSGSRSSTIAEERRSNLALVVDDTDVFVERLLAGLSAYPRYYVHVAPINRAGPAPVDLSTPDAVDAAGIRERIRAGEWVVDLRARSAYARRHVRGTVNVELGDSFATYLGWTLPWETPVTLLGDAASDIHEAQRQMVRIGIDRPAGAAYGGVDAWGADDEMGSYGTATFADLAASRERDDVIVVDVRRDDEWAQGRIDGALHVPLHELRDRVEEVPDAAVWVHCASGYRAAIAASLLDAAGRTVVAIDDEWDEASKHAALGGSG